MKSVVRNMGAKVLTRIQVQKVVLKQACGNQKHSVCQLHGD